MKIFILIILLFSASVFPKDFNSKFYQELTKRENGNINFSPISLKMALNLVYFGTDGKTKKFFEKEFAFSSGNRHTFLAEYELMTALEKEKDPDIKAELQLSNSVWFKDPSLIEKKYLKEINSINVTTGPLDVKKINDWVADATKGKINNIIETITPEMFAVFINAIYFKAKWLAPFKKEETREENFSTSNKEIIKVQMMHQFKHMPYHEDNHSQWIKLSYKGSPFSMYFGLPKKRFVLSSLEKALSDEYISNVAKGMDSKRVKLSLPKFKFDQKTSMKSTLERMGLEKIFEKTANYIRLSKSPELYISEIIQATYIKVDEEGTEAAAVTAVSMEAGSAPVADRPKIFLADQPFLFFLRNEKTKEIYFMGRVVKP